MLSEYDFEVEHRAGTKNCNADALSRGGKAEEADPEAEDTPAIQAMCIILPLNLWERRPPSHQCSLRPGEHEGSRKKSSKWHTPEGATWVSMRPTTG